MMGDGDRLFGGVGVWAKFRVSEVSMFATHFFGVG
jgi:hypothetical protein